MIKSFEFSSQNWHLLPSKFGTFNLIVGLSGVGKTRTLKALQQVASCATNNPIIAESCSWKLEVESNKKQWSWTATIETEPAEYLDKVFNKTNEVIFVNEKIICNGTIIAERNGDIRFKNTKIPNLKKSESLISLLQEEQELGELYLLLKNTIRSYHGHRLVRYQPKQLDTISKSCNDIQSLQKEEISLLSKAYLLQENFNERYATAVEEFIEIFPTVRSVKVGTPSELNNTVRDREEPIIFGLKEEGVEGVIFSSEWSSGMYLTWLHILELQLYPENSTLLIDEYENGLGVNCLPELTRILVSHSDRIQIILTSHHPYVISNIDIKSWKIMQRKGNTVSLRAATDFPRLVGLSRQDAFTQLVSMPEYSYEAIK